MKLISNKYRTELRNYHKQEETWGVGPKWNIIRICKFLYDNNIESVLDYGCGKGWYLPFILPININNYDPAVFKWSIVPKTQDYLLCIDVLEHVEPELIDETLADLFNRASKYQYHLIACHPAKKKLNDGRNAHLIIETPEWWKQKLETFGWTVEYEKITERYVEKYDINVIKYITVLKK